MHTTARQRLPVIVAGGALLLLVVLATALALAWRTSVDARGIPGAGPAAGSRAMVVGGDTASVHLAVLTAYVSTGDKGGSGGGGSGNGGNGNGGTGQGTVTPELPSGVLLLVGLVPLAAAIAVIGWLRRRRTALDAG